MALVGDENDVYFKRPLDRAAVDDATKAFDDGPARVEAVGSKSSSILPIRISTPASQPLARRLKGCTSSLVSCMAERRGGFNNRAGG